MTRKQATRAIQRIAKENHVSVEEVRSDMMEAILVGMNNPDPKIRARWSELGLGDKEPTPEDVIMLITDKISREIW